MVDFRRIRISESSTNKLRAFKGRTGITPNIACRVALALSLREANVPSLELYGLDESGQEINRETFLGDLELPLMSMYKIWCDEASVPTEQEFAYLMAHINRGVEKLTNRVRTLSDFHSLICETDNNHG